MAARTMVTRSSTWIRENHALPSPAVRSRVAASSANPTPTALSPRSTPSVRNTPQQEWRLFYDDIDGFTYEPGYDYRLKVQVSELTDVPADASSLNYRLIDTISKTRAKPPR